MLYFSFEEFKKCYENAVYYKLVSYNKCLLLCNAKNLKPCILFCRSHRIVEVLPSEMVLQRYSYVPSLEELWDDYQCATMALIESGDISYNMNNVSRETIGGKL